MSLLGRAAHAVAGVVRVAVLVAIGAGIVMATLAAAPRTDRTYDRAHVAQHADDVQIPNGGSLSDYADIDLE